jgi:histidinol-phosphatase (PHP family)
MSWPVDYHLHTPLCGHASGEPSEYAAQAVRAGLVEIGFSDHSPMPQDGFDNWRMRLDQLEEYVQKVEKARTDFPTLHIRLALEVDYLPGQEDWIRELSNRHPWDYLIGAVHYVSRDWAIDDPTSLSRWEGADTDAVWEQYVELLIGAVKTGCFEILAHIDLPKKFGHRPSRDCGPLYAPLFKEVVQAGAVIELNTAGLRKECREIYPSPQLLQQAYHEGVAITFGSDAHAPGEVGSHFAEALKLAQETGYRRCAAFRMRMKQFTLF